MCGGGGEGGACVCGGRVGGDVRACVSVCVCMCVCLGFVLSLQ